MRLLFDLNKTTGRLRVTLGGVLLSEEWGWRLMRAMEAELAALGAAQRGGTTLEDIERQRIAEALENNPDATYQEIADLLGVSKKTLWLKRKKYGLEPPGAEGKPRMSRPALTMKQTP